MTSGLEVSIFSVISFLGLIWLKFNSLNRDFIWLDPDSSLKNDDPARNGDIHLKNNWERLTVYSFFSGVIFGVAAFIVNSVNHWNQQSIVFSALGGFIFFQSVFTDFRLRRVDRHGQRIANLIAFLVGGYILVIYGTQIDWFIYILFIIIMFIFGFIKGFGKSDSRALVFLVLVTYPIAGVDGLKWGFILLFLAAFLYFIGRIIWPEKSSLKKVWTKMSIPMVPLVMLPTLIVTIFGRLF